MTILVCGEALYDVFTQSFDQSSFNIDMNAQVGGSACNVAIGVARLGCKVSLCTGVSKDFFGKHLKQYIGSQGVGVRTMIEKDFDAPLAIISVDKQGVPNYTFYAKNTAEQMILEQDLPDAFHFGILQFGCYSIVKNPTAESFLKFAANSKKLHNSFISLDPNIRLSIEPDILLWQKQVSAFAKYADIIKISDEDCRLLYPKENFIDKINQWLDDGVSMVVYTQGSEGVTVYSSKTKLRIKAQQIKVVDTVGAGDSFLAALLCQIYNNKLHLRDHRGKALLESVEISLLHKILLNSSKAAALTCTRKGPNLPYLKELNL